MRTMGEHFGLVTINEYRPRLDDAIRHADAERRLTGMYPMNFPQIFDFGDGLSGHLEEGRTLPLF